MRSLNYERPVSTPWGQVILVILCGLALALLAIAVPIYLVFVAFLGVAFCIVFLQRPDLGLLTILLVRASSDMSVWLTTQPGVGLEGRGSALTLNVGLILSVILCGGSYLLSRRVPFISLPGGILLTLMQVTGIVAMVHSHTIVLGLDAWLAVTSTIVVYALTAFLFQSPERIQRVINVLAASFVIPAALGFYQLAGQQIGTAGLYRLPGLGVIRAQGAFIHPNAFGSYLVVIFSVFITQVIAQSGMRRRLALLVVLASGVLLAGTYARFAWTGAIIVLLTVGLLSRRTLLIFALMGALFVGTLAPSLVARLAEPERNGSVEDRSFLWQSVISEWTAETAVDESTIATVVNRVAGLGPGAARILGSRSAYGSFSPPHDDYLRVLIEYGIFGLILYLLLGFKLVIFAYRTWRRSNDKVMRSIALSFFALTLAYPIMSLTDNLFGQTANQIFFWTLAGLTVAISRIPRQQDSETVPTPQRVVPLDRLNVGFSTGEKMWPQNSGETRF